MRLISTLPRSGTWYTKYLLTFIYRISANMDIDIREVYSHVKKLSQGRISRKQVSNLSKDGLLSTLPFVEVSHYICPGFLSLDDESANTARGILNHIGALDFHLEVEHQMGEYAPKNGAHLCFVYRNPFSVFMSYARGFNDRASKQDKKEVPFNPHWPIAVDFQNQPHDDPLFHYITNFRRSNFMEAFMVIAASYAHMLRIFPNNVRIVRYEDIHQDEYEIMRQILGFLGFPIYEKSFNTILNKSIQLVKKEKMSEYEQVLGHSLSGETNYYGEEKKNHFTITPKRNWKEMLASDDVAWAKDQVRAYFPGILHMLD